MAPTSAAWPGTLTKVSLCLVPEFPPVSPVPPSLPLYLLVSPSPKASTLSLSPSASCVSLPLLSQHPLPRHLRPPAMPTSCAAALIASGSRDQQQSLRLWDPKSAKSLTRL